MQMKTVTQDVAGEQIERRFVQGRIAVAKHGRVLLLRPSDVDWIESLDNYVSLHCGRTTHVLRATLASLEARLEPAGFLRLHRSAIVNLDKVKELYPLFRGDFRVVLQDGTELTLKKTYRERLQSRLLAGCLGPCSETRLANEDRPEARHMS